MKLIWHIIKKDISRDRWALVLWAMLFIGQVAIGFVALRGDGLDFDWISNLQSGNEGLVCLAIIMSYGLVARFVQSDAVIGTTQFWPTRPISAGRLLFAKMSGVFAVFCLLPVVLLMPWWIACDFGWREILWTAIEVVGWQLLVITPAFVVASLTDNLGRVLLWTVLLVSALVTWWILLVSSRSISLGNPFGVAVMYSRGFVSGLVGIVGGAAVVTHHYLTRRLARSVAMAVAWIGLIALVGLLWPWNWSRAIQELYTSAPPPIAAGLEKGLSFQIEAGWGEPDRKSTAKDGSLERDSIVDLRLRVYGLPDHMAIAAEHADQSWAWADGLKLERSGFYEPRYLPYASAVRRTFNLPVQPADPETVRWHQAKSEEVAARLTALGIHVQHFLKREGTPMYGYAPVPNSLIEKMRNEAPTYTATLDCFLFQPVVVGELPLKVDARASGRAQTFHLIRLDGEKPLIVTTKSAVTVLGMWNSTAVTRDFRSRIYSDRIMTMNRAGGDVASALEEPTTPPNLYVGGVVVTWSSLSILPPMVIRQGKWVPSDPQWFEHTAIVFLANKEVARFRREVTTDKFVLEPNAVEKINGSAGGSNGASVSPKDSASHSDPHRQ